MTYRGIENFYGNVWKMIDGLAWDGRWTGSEAAQPVYASNNAAYFNDESGANMTHLCDASYIGALAGYIGNIEEAVGFIPSNDGGSSTTKVCDYYYQYSEAARNYWRVPLVGGYAGSLSGAVALFVVNSWTYANASFAARICF